MIVFNWKLVAYLILVFTLSGIVGSVMHILMGGNWQGIVLGALFAIIIGQILAELYFRDKS